MNRVLLTNQRWEKIKPLLPSERGYWGRPSRPHRRILEGILWILRTGAPYCITTVISLSLCALWALW